MSLRIAVFASGGGTNLQAILDHFGGVEAAPAWVRLVVSDRPDAGALERAIRAGVEARVIPVAGRAAEDVAHETLAALREAGIDLVVLAGYIRLVPAEIVRAYAGRMLNIHPALLPAFGGQGMYGIRVHRAVLAAGCTVSGATVHFVDEHYDQGRILLQWPVPVLPGDTPEALAARVLRVEHRILPVAVEAVARGVAEGEVTGTRGVEPLTFGLTAGDAPTLDEVRRLMGLEEVAGGTGAMRRPGSEPDRGDAAGGEWERR